jgi:hypothetical protein
VYSSCWRTEGRSQLWLGCSFSFSLLDWGCWSIFFFGRDTKAFSKRSKLLMQNLEANAMPLLWPVLSRQDAELRGGWPVT